MAHKLLIRTLDVLMFMSLVSCKLFLLLQCKATNMLGGLILTIFLNMSTGGFPCPPPRRGDVDVPFSRKLLPRMQFVVILGPIRTNWQGPFVI
jgi:hypothetical protein